MSYIVIDCTQMQRGRAPFQYRTSCRRRSMNFDTLIADFQFEFFRDDKLVGINKTQGIKKRFNSSIV